jgi:hypothetical protein
MDQQQLLQEMKRCIALNEKITFLLNQLLDSHRPDNRWLSGADVKIDLNISESTLGRLRKENEIPHTKIGKSYFYPSVYLDHVLIKRVLASYLKLQIN